MGWGHEVWLALLVAASAAFSFVFACATPFAAFGAAAALTLSRRDALRLTVAVWLANQVIKRSRKSSRVVIVPPSP